MKRSQKQLAGQLRISQSMVSRLVKKGMPTTSLAAAKRWRDENLNPALVKESRGWAHSDELTGIVSDASDMPPAGVVAVDAENQKIFGGFGGETCVRIVAQLGRLAEMDFDAWHVNLREALRDTPREMRDRLQIPMAVWDKLVAESVAALDAWAVINGESPYRPSGTTMSVEDADWSDDFCYCLATGSIRVKHPSEAGQASSINSNERRDDACGLPGRPT